MLPGAHGLLPPYPAVRRHARLSRGSRRTTNRVRSSPDGFTRMRGVAGLLTPVCELSSTQPSDAFF